MMLTGALLGPNLLISGRSTNFVVLASGGTPHAVKEFYPWPQMLPDGKHLLFTAFDSRAGRHRARVVRFGERETAFVFPDGSGRFLGLEHGILAYRRYQSKAQLAWVTRQGELLRTVGPANVNLKQARISPDGRKPRSSMSVVASTICGSSMRKPERRDE